MHILTLIWWATIAMAVCSLLAMVTLIIQRAWRNWHHRRDGRRRMQLQQLALVLIHHPDRLFEMEKQLRPDDRRLLLEVYDELLPKIRGEYADRLVSLMRILGLLDECLRRLRDGSWWVRSQACRALGAFRDPNVILALYRAVEDPVEAVRLEAARSLARLGVVRSVNELVRQVAAGEGLPSLPVMDLFRSLGRKGVPELVALLEGEAGLSAKIVAADALGHIGDLSAVPALLHLYDHTSLHVRMTAMEALARLGDPRALPAVLLAMTDPAWEVRAQAASAAGRIGAAESVPLLQQMLRDEHWWVRYYAAEALYRIGGSGVAALREAVAGDHPWAAEMAGGLLNEKGQAA